MYVYRDLGSEVNNSQVYRVKVKAYKIIEGEYKPRIDDRN